MLGTFNLKSSYSMLESLITLEDLFIKAKKENYEFLALTDNKLHGVVELFNYSKKYNIKPVLGLHVILDNLDKDHFLLYVKNEIGYKNLLKISFIKEKQKNNSLDDLLKYQEGLIMVSLLNNGTSLLNNSLELSIKLNNYQKQFDNYYVGISNNSNDNFNELYNYLVNNNLKPVLAHETNYLEKSDRKVYEVLNKISNSNYSILENSTYHFLTNEELLNVYTNYDLIRINHEQILSEITYEFKKVKYHMPEFKTKDNIEPKKYLENLAHVGLSRRLKNNNITEFKPYIDRLNYELNIINNMDFTNYFLIVYDFIRYAKQNKVLVGPGRGSAAGSLTSYVLGITEVDPIKYNLLFERFLNPERTSMPDIDIDFPDDKRDMIINYVKEKYGINHIASITTFQTLQTRSSIRDVSRVLNIDQSKVKGIIEAKEQNRIDKTDMLVNEIIETAAKIEGLYRQTGTHAAGIILAKEDLFESIPMQIGAYDFYQAEYEMNTLEDLGLIKIDFLGIRNLTIINNVLEKIKIKDFNIYNLNLEDLKTYKLLQTGNTTGIFQLESDGMRNVLRKLKPENFEDIVATLALYRPGPMENIDVYIERKKGKSFKYLHQSLEQILKPTYGIIIYQEQIMEIARTFAGYSLMEADMLRVGISKKDEKILINEKDKFIKSSIKNGHSKEDSVIIYDYILKFADYGFNRSHSVSYALVAYQMTYLKANHYLEFMSELLNSVIGNQHQTLMYINEVINSGYKVLPPNINYSTNKYQVVGNKLLLPLSIIRSIGLNTYNKLIEERNLNGLFRDYNEFKTRVKEILNETNLNNIIHSGALDLFEHSRNTMITNNQLSSAGMESFIKDYKMNELEEFSYVLNQGFEFEAIGFNLKYNINTLIKQSKKYKNHLAVTDLIKMNFNKAYSVCGIVTNKKTIILKNNSKMMFMTFSDGITEIDLTVFNDQLELANSIDGHKIVCLNIYKSKYQNKDSYRLNNLIKLKED